MACTASGADSAISAASWWAAARGSPSSRSHSPMRRASVPSMRRPVARSSRAVCGPTARGSVIEMPKPWWKPSRAKLAANRLSGAATRKSPARASPSPPPMAAPWMATTTGQGPVDQGRAPARTGPRRASGSAARRPTEVEAGAEVTALRAQHHGPGALRLGPADGVDHAAQEVGVEVVGRRAVQSRPRPPGRSPMATVTSTERLVVIPSLRRSAGDRSAAGPRPDRRPGPRPAPRRCADRSGRPVAAPSAPTSARTAPVGG